MHGRRGGDRGARGGTAPQKFCLAPQWPPKIFRVTSCHCIEVLHRPLTASLVAKLAPPVLPYILNYVCTGAYIFIEGRRLCTRALHSI